MPRVDFYILADDDERRRLNYLCRLVEKAWRLGHRVWIHAPAGEHARVLDEHLWTFSQGSFVPHERAGGEEEASCPIVIGDRPDDADARHLLVNEAEEIPPFIERFARIAEVVNQSPSIRSAARARYTRYRESGCELHHHQVNR